MRGLILLPLLLAACGTSHSWQSGSYADKNISPQQGETLGRTVADYVTATLPQGSAVHVVKAGSHDQIASVAAPLLTQAGFTDATSAHQVTYVAQPLEGGMMLRTSIDNAQGASAFYSIGGGGVLTQAGPLTAVTP